ncbi:glycerate kinase [Fulvivirga sp. M361]|uniref:glycerate kinase family protein n=1 Tax=Fulvivirga sp. M361 TaxID=2594266 RepID=UPI00117A52E6|nr:glycerate kinase [Fulvivirga sp. M361]TRX59549.1 glycerate kinase [Fulvivirga sp. M361]
MRVLIAPNNFKESISANDAADAIKQGLLAANPSINTNCLPLSDGGEGFVKALVAATGGSIIDVRVSDPLGRQIDTYYGVIHQKTAVIEMALASGLELIREQERDPWMTTTYGTGELIKDAIDRGYKNIIIGLGGSATNDAGMGMIQALGGVFYDKDARVLGQGAKFLDQVKDADIIKFRRKTKRVRFIAACDVTNPLIGQRGATYVYGPQKGAGPEALERLENGVVRYSEHVNAMMSLDYTRYPGAGAAGGLGYALLTFMRARLIPGFDLVADYTDLKMKIQQADLIITGEGKIDAQTMEGKTIARLTRLAKKHKKPIVALAGRVDDDIDLNGKGIERLLTITDRAKNEQDALQNAGYHLKLLAQEIGESLFKISDSR